MAGAAFEDTWTLDKEDVAWMGLIADQHPASPGERCRLAYTEMLPPTLL